MSANAATKAECRTLQHPVRHLRDRSGRIERAEAERNRRTKVKIK